MIATPGRKALLLFAMLLFFGCQTTSKAVTYYTLTALDPKEIGTTLQPASQDLAVGVGPVTLPAYLDRGQIVTRSGPNRLRVDDYHHWAGPLQADILSVVGDNLRLLTGARIETFPWDARFKPQVRVRIALHAFEGLPDNKVRMSATVTVGQTKAGSKPVSWTVDLEEDAGSDGYDALVAAQSRLIVALSKEIAAKIANL